MKKHLSALGLLAVLFLIFGLNADRPAQEIGIKISPDKDAFVAGTDQPRPVFKISTKPHCLICVELAINNKAFAGSDRAAGLNFFSSLFGDAEVKGEEIFTDDMGTAAYELPIALWSFWTGNEAGTRIYYRALAIDAENSDLVNKKAVILASSLRDGDWENAPSVEVFATADEKHEYDHLAEARVPYKKGMDLYREENYEEAILEFEKANEIASRGNIDWAIALCHLQLARAYAEKALHHPTSSDEARGYAKRLIDAVNALNPGPGHK